MGLGVITDILVRGKRVIPARASALGYQFSFPVLDAALHRSAITSEVASAPGSAPRTQNGHGSRQLSTAAAALT
jgi:hypothetical protein